MTVRVVSPADLSAYVTYTWDNGQQTLAKGQLISVDPGSALETAIGAGNLITPASQVLTDAANGGAGAISN